MQDTPPSLAGQPPAKATYADAQSLAAALLRPIVFVDLETTGADAQHDRITEIGVVEVGPDGIQEWDTLLDPGASIPPFIQRLTGITDEMVRGQPTFASIAETLAERLQGRLFVAHNARFDYGFLKNEFRRAGLTFRADVLCTVRLSRSLFPSAAKHGLDALVARFGLEPRARHRALADAELLWQFWQKIHALYSVELIAAATQALVRRASLPAGLEETALDDVPDTAGVYLFYGDNDAPLYIGKSVHLRQRIGAHFSGDHRVGKDMRLARLVRRVEWRETGGEIGALLLEASLVKSMQPIHNQMLRRNNRLYTWELAPELPVPRLRSDDDTDFSRRGHLYGTFPSRGAAQAWLRRLADDHQLCHATLLLEKTTRAGSPCFARQLHRCEGACVGEEDSRSHRARIAKAMAGSELKPWPFSGPVAWSEASGTQNWWHVVEDWCYLGSAPTQDDAAALLAAPARFELDTYQILVSRLPQWMPHVVHLASTRSFELALCEPPVSNDGAISTAPRRQVSGKARARHQPSPGLFDV
ncbi:exonuclease domain-containing protein [Cupriavidus sp. WKF15]|uniref:3'-5' exonuclease family protein n=1 Tax=Cupriavidus sp. WKF15 TaxID=3032282 RepID=UPI0023E33999|nr:3'-5' exonuclease family protein [Cupriavidus sp. WKF15]WER47873.1 exonuclease domain-containing protein [Cupriavidus sp. WKF15]